MRLNGDGGGGSSDNTLKYQLPSNHAVGQKIKKIMRSRALGICYEFYSTHSLKKMEDSFRNCKIYNRGKQRFLFSQIKVVTMESM